MTSHVENGWVVGTPHRKIGYGQYLRRQRSKTHVINQSPIKRQKRSLMTLLFWRIQKAVGQVKVSPRH